MRLFPRLAAAAALLVLSACAGMGGGPVPYVPAVDGWIASPAATRLVGLGLPGAELAPGVRFVGGVELVAEAGSPLHSLSDLKLTDRDGGFVSVTDVGDLVRGRILLDAEGRLSGLDALSTRRLTLADGEPIQDKADGDAEGLVLLPNGHLLVSFERNHRIWDYGRLPGLNVRPVAVRHPDFAFAENDGMEGVAASSTGWIVTGESGGAWDCAPVGCRLITPPPATPIPDADFRITGMDRDPSGPGWFVVQRAFSLPAGPRAHIRRMAPNGELGPVLVSLKLPGTTDNFEGITAETRDGRTRLYILSDDNFSPIQRTLMLAFDVDPRP
ncbi:MAG: esterase-like activity of phytase family protein [Brevundimonas sp.]|uniref:esterase-like activity of phytase family protein n=2 Tax=Brevundimonas sp. TaxID=1871086 RepID=UPI004034CF49